MALARWPGRSLSGQEPLLPLRRGRAPLPLRRERAPLPLRRNGRSAAGKRSCSMLVCIKQLIQVTGEQPGRVGRSAPWSGSRSGRMRMPPASPRPDTGRRGPQDAGSRYKWVALSNTTLGVLMATVNASIMLIALPDIFRGIGVNPLQPGNTSLLLWLIMGYLVVTAVLVVSFGRLGDMFGRVRMFNLGFAI